MLATVWSPKGGVGTTVTAVVVASVLARRRSVRLVDFGGDVPAVCGAHVGVPLGAADWLALADAAPPDALDAMALEIGEPFSLVPLGPNELASPSGAALEAVAQSLADGSELNVVDAGRLPVRAIEAFLAVSVAAVAVVRPCYMALSRCAEHHALLRASTGLAVVCEPGRALTIRDVETVLERPVLASVPCTPDIARCVDAGVLLWRAPHELFSSVQQLVDRLALPGAIDPPTTSGQCA